MKQICEISIEALEQLLEENEKNYKLLRSLLKSAGVETGEREGEGREECEVNLKQPVRSEKMNPYILHRWDAVAEILSEELSDFEENREELESIKYLCRTKEEYADLEREVQVSEKLINALQEVLHFMEEREQLREAHQ